MERPDYVIKLDMVDTGTIETGIRIKQGDYGITFYFKIYNNGNEYYDKNYIPEVYFRRPDGSTIIGKATEGHNDMYIYVIVGNELEIAGTVIMDIKFKFEGGRGSSASCSFECVMDTLGKTVENSNIYWNDVTRIIEELDEKTKDAEALAWNLSDIVSQTTANAGAAGESASLAQSYAVGGTGKRTGEDTDNAKYYKERAETYLETVSNNAELAAEAERKSAEYKESAKESESKAAESEAEAERLESNAGEYASLAQSYAVGGTGKRTGEDTDNAKYYKEQVERLSSSVTNALKPWGTIQFSQLPQEADSGDMYNISDEFTTDDRFKDGAGITYPAGTNVYYTYDGYWDCLAGDLSKLQNHINKMQEAIGEADISDIGDGTVTGAIDELHKNIDSLVDKIYPVGSIYMSVSDTNPAELFGGTWVAWGAGRVPVGVNASDADFKTVEKTGGVKTQALRAAIGATNNSTHKIGYAITDAIPNISYTYSLDAGNSTGPIPASQVNHSTPVYQTNGASPTTLQPYVTCYMWKRTA